MKKLLNKNKKNWLKPIDYFNTLCYNKYIR